MKKVIIILLLLLSGMKVSTGEYKTSSVFGIPKIIQNIPYELKYKILEGEDITIYYEREKLGYSYQEQYRIDTITNKLGIETQWLYDVFYLECRHNHHAINLMSGAVGLIQFMPRTMKKFNTNTVQLLSMDKYSQLNYVYKYLNFFKPLKGYKSRRDLYLAIFWPKAIGQTPCYQIGGYTVWKYNSGIDKKGNMDGRITISDIESWINYNIS